jgi:VIT1/CCC1 family predicted Fe2+/Mn2+ transporter
VKRSHKSGLGFGVASGIITPLGLIAGLYSGTQSALIIVGGILTIAIADAFSDSLGIHFSKKSDRQYSLKEVWEATITTFVTKFFFAIMFIVPFLLLPVKVAVVSSIAWGAFLLSAFTFFIARSRNECPWWSIGEHLLIATVVVVMTYYLPILIQSYFI